MPTEVNIVSYVYICVYKNKIHIPHYSWIENILNNPFYVWHFHLGKVFFIFHVLLLYENDILWVIYLKNKNPPHLKYFFTVFSVVRVFVFSSSVVAQPSTKPPQWTVNSKLQGIYKYLFIFWCDCSQIHWCWWNGGGWLTIFCEGEFEFEYSNSAFTCILVYTYI